ncbi:Crp/Fnr family transcriptional regulator [Malikia granosa]|uniref:Cyclic nucleotide-binding domain-containing protein n=1 Tax=Malikia granosa TaxID=263067 RepID=A0A2S9K5W0_9BURK|nr:Crp/Fnr family transcriptional regulator [Malikia granosa]PRD65846.1 hypothetical protein C6P64_07025 [Malikia granosa]
MIQEKNLPRELARGNTVFVAGESGPLWRVTWGVVALQSSPGADGRLVQLAVAGDLLGIESLCEQDYALEARALTACRLELIEPVDGQHRSLLMREALLQQLERSIDMAELRTGAVSDRLSQMLHLLGHDWLELRTAPRPTIEAVRRDLPSLSDLARAIDAQKETVCRVLGRLLPSQKPRRAMATAFVPATLGLAA